MTIQEIAPAPAPTVPVEPPAHNVTDVLLAPAPPADLEECPDLIEHLRKCLDKAIAIADRHAEKGGAERLKAEHLLLQAARYDDAAMAARVQVEKWKEQLAFALEQAAREREAEREALALAVAETRGNPYPHPPMIHCGECGAPIRPLTPDEQAAMAAGQPLPDVRGECPACLLATQNNPAEP